ncbi:MAG: hypothetical protein AB7K41_06650 [Bdellovibrionales bacterium]
MALLLMGCASTPEKTGIEGKAVEIQSFPSETWDGKTIEYLSIIKFPSLAGKTKKEAENIRRLYVQMGLKKSFQFLFRIVKYDPTAIQATYSGSCEDLAPLKQKTCPMTKMSTGEKNLDFSAWSEFIKFAEPLPKSTDVRIKYVEDRLLNFEDIPILTSIKDSDGNMMPTVYFAPDKIVPDHYDGFLTTEFQAAEYEGQIKINDKYDVRFELPSAAIFVPLDKKADDRITLIAPHEKLANLFHKSAPNLSTAFLAKMDSEISKKLEPYSIALASGGADGGTIITNLIQDELYNQDEDSSSEVRMPSWISDVDIPRGKAVFCYLLLYAAKIEAERHKEDGLVVFKISVNMDELLRLAKVEPYEKHMEK